MTFGHLSGQLKGQKIRSELALRRRINKIWRAVTPDTCKKLVRAVPIRFKDVIKNGGRRLLSRRGQSKN